MKMRFSAPLLLALLAGCSDDDPTSPALEAAVLSVLGGLDAGEAITLSGADTRTLTLDGGENGAEYVYVPFFASSTGKATLAVEVSGAGVQGVSGPPNPSQSPSGLSGLAAPGSGLADDEAFHLQLRQREAELVDRRLASPGWPAARSALLNRILAQATALPQIGDTIRLNVATESPCEDAQFRDAVVKVVSDHAIVVADTENPQGGFSDAEFQEIAREFDQLVWPVDTRNFGEPADIDDNERVTLFFTSAVNELTPPDAGFTVAGFFFGRDLFPRAECPGSNLSEIFYLVVPDPQGAINGNIQPRELLRLSSTGVVGHEFQHLINLSRRLFVNNAQEGEEVWLNEGLSHIAEELLFYEVAGVTPRSNLGITELRANEGLLSAVNRFQIANLARYNEYLRNPDAETLLGIDEFDDDLGTRGATWAFLRYAADREEGEDQDFFFDLVNSTTSGVANLRNVLEDFNPIDLMQAWTLSVYTDDFVPGVRPVFMQPSWNFRTILPALRSNRDEFPLPVRDFSGSGPLRFTLQGGGAAFVRFAVAPGGQATISTSSGGAVPPGSLRISVVRTR